MNGELQLRRVPSALNGKDSCHEMRSRSEPRHPEPLVLEVGQALDLARVWLQRVWVERRSDTRT